MSRGIALLFLGPFGTRWGGGGGQTQSLAVSTLEKDPVPIVQEVGWAPDPVWTDGKSRSHRVLTTDRPVRSQSLYQLSYPAHVSRIKREKKPEMISPLPTSLHGAVVKQSHGLIYNLQ